MRSSPFRNPHHISNLKLRLSGLLLISALCLGGADLRIGIVGTDTSHAVVFTTMLNDDKSPDHVPGGRVIAAYKGGSKDVEASYTRVDKFAEELRSKWNVEMAPDIPTLCSKVDAVLLESNDGRTHLDQAKLIIAAHKPLFIDKPLASTLEDATEIARIAKQAGVPWFSSSSLRYSGIATQMKVSDAQAVITWGPGPLEEHQQLDLSWYAIHAIEMLYALLGTGCQEVARTYTADGDILTGAWNGGRTGTVRTLRPYGPFGAVVFRPKQVLQSPPESKTPYRQLALEIVKFFETGTPPVPNHETLEIMSFMDAAQRSREANGRPMKLK
jgi:hypothetical protein